MNVVPRFSRLRRRARWCVPALLVTVAGSGFIACTADSAPAATTRYALRKVATADSPVGVYVAPGSSTLLVLEQTGRIRPLTGSRLGDAVLDVSKDISTGGERGLLGMAFSPEGDRLYVNLTNDDGDTEVREYQWRDGTAVVSSQRLLMKVEQPFSNHNGGNLVVDRSGLLWIGMGDGGSGGDPGNRAQNRRELLGKLLRIDPTPSGDRPYSIPPENPYADGVNGAPEVWAVGLRNPWRFTVDETARQVVVADVGQNNWEEITVVPLNKPGANLGWNRREAKHAYQGGSRPAGNVEPVFEYSHSTGCSITGGTVYRGTALPELRGTYLFGDYCKGWIATLRPRVGTWSRVALGVTQDRLTGFGTDGDGEVYVTSGSGAISRLTRR